MTANLAEARAEPQTQPLLVEAGESTGSPVQGARPRGLRTVAVGAVALLLGGLGLAAVVGRRPVPTPPGDAGQKVEQFPLSDGNLHLPSLALLPRRPITPTIVPRVDCIKLCGLVDPCRAKCARDGLTCRKNITECTKESNACQSACTAAQNHDANCLTNCVMSNGKSLSGSLSGYLRTRLVEHVKDRAKDRVNDLVDHVWRSRGEIIETLGNKAKGIAEVVQDRLEHADGGAKGIEDALGGRAKRHIDAVWENHDAILETTRDEVKDLASAVQDKLKKAGGGAKGIKDLVRGRVNHKLGDVWEKRGEIVETARDKVKDLAMMAQDVPKTVAKGVKGRVKHQIDDIRKRHGGVVETTRGKVKDLATVAQDKLKSADDAAKGIKDAVEGQGKKQIDTIWKHHGAIVETTGDKAKEFTELAQDDLKKADGDAKGAEGRVKDQMDKVWRNRDKVIGTTRDEAKDMVKRAQDELGVRMQI